MENQTSDTSPAPRHKMPPGAMNKKYETESCTFTSKWVNLTKGDVSLQFPEWSTSGLEKLVFLRAKLGIKRTKQLEWEVYFNWYAEARR